MYPVYNYHLHRPSNCGFYMYKEVVSFFILVEIHDCNHFGTCLNCLYKEVILIRMVLVKGGLHKGWSLSLLLYRNVKAVFPLIILQNYTKNIYGFVKTWSMSYSLCMVIYISPLIQHKWLFQCLYIAFTKRNVANWMSTMLSAYHMSK